MDSIGNAIFLAGEQRYACKNSSFMFHGVGFDTQGQKIRLERKLLRERLQSIEADQRKIGGIISERTKMTMKEVEESFLEQVTRDPDEALGRGIIHEVREVEIPKGAPIRQLVFKR